MAKKKNNNSGANLGFEEKLWAAADKMRGHMDAAEYKHVALGIIFLKHISDSFQELYNKLKQDKYGDPEDRDEYLAENVFWVPKEARWKVLQNNAKQPTIGKLIDDAMVAIEKENPKLKGVLPKNYGRADLDKQRLGELIDLIGTITLGDSASQSKEEQGVTENSLVLPYAFWSENNSWFVGLVGGLENIGGTTTSIGGTAAYSVEDNNLLFLMAQKVQLP